MTVTTQIHLFAKSDDAPELDPYELFEFIRPIVALDPQHSPMKNADGSIQSPVGVGAKAWVKVDADFIKATIWLDTDNNGPYCEVHNAVVQALLATFPQFHCLALNEFEGVYHYNKEPY